MQEALNTKEFFRVFYNKGGILCVLDKASKGELWELGNRHIAWRLFLGVISEQESPTVWVRRVKDSRERYYSLKSSYKVSAEGGDPLTSGSSVSHN